MEVNTYYQNIYNYLLEEIAKGKFSAGDRLPTELELSKQFGVSRITSKKALNMLEEAGYIVRFRAKGSFVTNVKPIVADLIPKKSLIGVVLSEIADDFGQRTLYSIEKTCKELGYHLILKFSYESLDLETGAIKELADLGVAGILIQAVQGEYYNEAILRIALEKKNLVFIDRKMSGIPIPSIISNNVEGARQGTGYLFQLGHKNIAAYTINPIKGTSALEDRWEGYCKAFMEAKMPINTSFLCTLNEDYIVPTLKPEKIIEDHLSRHQEITAAIAFNYRTAYQIKAAAETIGKRVPQDFSIVCFDMPSSLIGSPPFTCLYQDEDDMGKRAVNSLHDLIQGKRELEAVIAVPEKLIIGHSTAANCEKK